MRRRAGTETRLRAFVERILDEATCTGPPGEEVPHASVAFGAGGMAYALWYASRVLDDGTLAAQARRWLDAARALAYERHGLHVPERGLDARVFPSAAAYPGLGGLQALAYVMARDEAADADRRELLGLIGPRRRHELLFGTAGELLMTTLVSAHRPHPLLARRANQLARALLSSGRRGGAHPWGRMRYSGLAHGRGGVYFALLKWAKLSGHRLPAWFWRSLRTLAEAGVRDGKAMNWPIRTQGTPLEFRSAWCSGSAGLTLLWALAFEVSHDELFYDVTQAAALDAERNAAPWGDLCCGLTGTSYALYAAARIAPAGNWLEKARHAALRAISVPEPCNGLFKGRSGQLCLALDTLGESEPRAPSIE